MKKVVFLAKYFAPHVGGVEEHVQKLAEELYKRGYQITIITNLTDLELPTHETLEKYQILRIPTESFDNKLKTWRWTLQYIKVFFRADIIHAHDVFWWILPIRFLLFWKKFFITFHGYEGSYPPKTSQIRAHQLWNLLSNGSLAIGEFHNKWYQLETTAVSYGAVDTVHSSTSTSRKKNDIISAVYIGRLAEDVGIMEYLEAIRVLNKKGKNVTVDIYGDGDQRQQAEEFAKEHTLPITFYGFIKNAEQKLSHYDVAFVSRYLAILSALSQRVPVIAHANNEIKYDYLALSPFAKWISICQNREQIINAVLHHTKVSENATKWATQQTWSSMADIYEKIWVTS